MLVNNFFKHERNTEHAQKMIEVTDEQNVDIVIHNYLDMFNNSKMLIKNGAKILVKERHAKNIVDGIALFAEACYNLKHIETVINNDRTIIVLKGHEICDIAC